MNWGLRESKPPQAGSQQSEHSPGASENKVQIIKSSLVNAITLMLCWSLYSVPKVLGWINQYFPMRNCFAKSF